MTFLRAVDGRACLTPPVSMGYIGNLVAGAFTELPLQGITGSLFLSAIALTVRKATRSIDGSLHSKPGGIYSRRGRQEDDIVRCGPDQ